MTNPHPSRRRICRRCSARRTQRFSEVLIGEFDFINAWRARLADHAPNRRLPLGPGDDAAVCETTTATLVATDMLMDGVHFKLKDINPALAGRKALAVNLSDIAAMGGRPTTALVSLALPRAGGEALAHHVMSGLVELAAAYNVAIAGGDTNSWDGPLVIAVTIMGEPHKSGAIMRSGAQVGDAILVTGRLGGSLSGRHLTFDPRVKEGLYLAEHARPNAMIDISDGLAADLGHILDASGVGAVLNEAAIPVNAHAALAGALGDGEDFELCFTLPPVLAARLLAARPFGPQVPVTQIGSIVKDPGLHFQDGRVIARAGYVHGLA